MAWEHYFMQSKADLRAAQLAMWRPAAPVPAAPTALQVGNLNTSDLFD